MNKLPAPEVARVSQQRGGSRLESEHQRDNGRGMVRKGDREGQHERKSIRSRSSHA
jgi:hypothetical protein